MGILDTISSAIYGDNSSKMNDLLSNISLNNRFRVMISNPVGISSLFDIEKDSFMVNSINIPSSTIDAYESTYSGIRKNIAQFRQFDNITIEFLDTNKGELRKKFEKWHNYIHDVSSGKLKYYNDYIASTLQLNILSFKSDKNYNSVIFYEVWPVNVSEVLYSRNGNSELVKFSVSFTFKKIVYSSTSQTDENDVLNIIKQGVSNTVDEFTSFISNTF